MFPTVSSPILFCLRYVAWLGGSFVGAQAAWDAVTVLDLMNGCEVSVYVPMRTLRHVDDVHFRRVDGCTICQPVQTRNRGNLAHYGSQCVRTLPLLVRFGPVAALWLASFLGFLWRSKASVRRQRCLLWRRGRALHDKQYISHYTLVSPRVIETLLAVSTKFLEGVCALGRSGEGLRRSVEV